MGLLEKVGEVFSRPKRADVATSPQHKAGYMRDNRNSLFAGWRPAIHRSYVDVANGWEMAAARATEMIQNSGYLSGMVDQYVSDTIGRGLQLRIKPNVKYFDGDEDKAMAWGSDVERRFRMWAARPVECDAENRNSFGKMQAVQARAYLAFGETFCSTPLLRRNFSKYLTKFKVIPPYLMRAISNGTDVIHGVKIDEFGAPLGYHFLQKSAPQQLYYQDIYIDRVDSWGRANVIHVFDGQAAQVRGISPIAPALQVLRQFDRLQDATLTAATLQTIFAATIESQLPTREVLDALKTPGDPANGDSLIDQWLSGIQGWNQNVDINLGTAGRIAHMMPNETLKFNKNEHPNQFYDKFVGALLREVARCIGLPVESATGDFSAATYASLNIGTTINYSLTLQRRQNIFVPMCDQMFDCWMEEDVEQGNTKFPGGVDGWRKERTLAYETSWRGPGKPQADDLKAAKASEVLLNNNLASATELAEERGRDIDDIHAELAREASERKRLGLKDPVPQRAPTVDEQKLLNESEPAPRPQQ